MYYDEFIIVINESVKMQYLTLDQFRATVDSGGVLSVTLRAQGPAFAVQAETRRGDAILVDTRRKTPRLFVDPRKALKMLRELGIRKAELDAEQWRPEEADLLRPARPDASKRMQSINERASYDTWFREQVQASMDDPRPSVSDEESRARFSERKAALMKTSP